MANPKGSRRANPRVRTRAKARREVARKVGERSNLGTVAFVVNTVIGEMSVVRGTTSRHSRCKPRMQMFHDLPNHLFHLLLTDAPSQASTRFSESGSQSGTSTNATRTIRRLRMYHVGTP